MRLKDKVAVLTGGGKGIGKQTALLFAQEGADVVILGPMPDELELVRKEVETLSRRCLAYEVNVADEGQVNAAIEASMNYPAASCGVSKNIDENLSQRRHPRTFSSGVQSQFRLDFRRRTDPSEALWRTR